MEKLSRLEHIIKHLASENKGGDELTVDDQAEKDADHEQPSAKSEEGGKEALDRPSLQASETSGEIESSLDVQFGRLVISDSKSYYVGNVLWANLANEVQLIRPFVRQLS